MFPISSSLRSFMSWVPNIYSTESVECNFQIEIIFVCIRIQYTHKSTHPKKKKQEHDISFESRELKATNNGLRTWLNKWIINFSFTFFPMLLAIKATIHLDQEKELQIKV